MLKSNQKLKNAIAEIDREHSQLLADTVKEIADRRGSELRNRADLFYQTEPFAREFDEYGLLDPGDRPDLWGFTMTLRLSSIGRSSGLKKYRAMFFAWMSYYHPKEAEAFCRKIGHDIPMYEGHPDLTDCSEEAKEWFVKQTRREHEVMPNESDADTVALGIDDAADSEFEKTFDTHDETPPSRNRKTLLIAFVLILGVVGTLGVLVMGQEWFNPTVSEASPELPSDQVATNSEDAGAAFDDIESSVADDLAVQEADDDYEAEQPEPTPTRQVNPVWDQISAQAWSVQPLASFRSWARRANRQELLEAARGGNRNAQALTGMGYHLGAFGEVNHRLALSEYLRPACEAGHGRACALIGAFYGQGDMGVPQNHQTARGYYSQACRLGNQMGCFLESTRLISGFAGEQDVGRGYAQLRGACDSGVRDACRYAAQAYASGWNTTQDVAQSRRYYSQARRLGHPQTQAPFDEWFEQSGYVQR